ncbi:carbohydrate ABC transporter permease [Nocardiopsis sp. RSe5-2]|uniref:Carbohydrate ABC transporter permease n=1 Tax=Nocardiopsis endophytica TaxID=3018445 RepID=A0ABT4UCE4_9ACTN|nr:carbohydrate ABC transporter permease [Nocardiopsis endophytica]MDA2814659.1 carbohydrate ABC transporter permease [Nocardiopsis endophytica]
MTLRTRRRGRPGRPPGRPRPWTVASPRRAVAAALVHALLAVLAAAFVLPALWLVAAFDSEAASRARLPREPTLDHFAAVATPDTLFVPLANSLWMCGGAALVTVVASVLAAYPLSRFQLRFGRPFLYTVLFATGLPITAIMVPVYSLFSRIGMVDSRWGVMLFLAAAGMPFGIWLTKSFLDGIPVELEEAAWADGATARQSLLRVVVPLALPGLSVVGVFTLVLAWGNFFVPFVLLQTPERLPAAVRIYTFFGQYGSMDYGPLAAYSLLYTLPVVLLYAAVARLLGGGFSLGGAMKG